MTPSEVFKSNFSLATATLLQIILPSLIATGSLYACAYVGEVPIDDLFVRFSLLVLILSAVVMQPPQLALSELLEARRPVAFTVVIQWGALLILLLTIGYATRTANVYSRIVLTSWAMVTPVLLILAQLLLYRFVRHTMARPDSARRAVFAGYNDLTQSLVERVRDNAGYGLSVCGFFDDRGADRLNMRSAAPLLGRLPDLPDYVRQNKVEVIFIALPIRHVARVMNLLDDLRDSTASIYYVPDIFVFDLVQARTSAIAGIPVVAMCETPFYGYRGAIKRAFDLAVSLAATLLLAPLMIAASLCIKFTSAGPVIFRQRRYGLDGREIEVFKFRTMTVMEDGHQVQQATRDDNRVTAVGKVLRRLSIDELPQLFNVVRGNMSLVGPRPHAVAHNEQYRKLIKGYMVRHKVLPGMTGLAQVNGCRGEIEQIEDMERRVSYDLEYLRTWSPLLDVRIIGLTVLRMFGDKRAY